MLDISSCSLARHLCRWTIRSTDGQDLGFVSVAGREHLLVHQEESLESNFEAACRF